MKTIRERISLNGQPIAEKLFAERFFEIWNKLPQEATPALDIPRYLQFLTLLSFHVFMTEKVDVAIFETHFGGEYCATNIIKHPVITGITKIGLDHIDLLGPGIEDIAWHKAGILKKGSLAFSCAQDLTVRGVLQRRAAEKEVTLEFVPTSTSLPKVDALKTILQRQNCSLALHISQAWLRKRTSPAPQRALLAETISLGIQNFSWPGRFQKIVDGSCRWFLDGAHTEMSLRFAVNWFVKELTAGTVRVLVFSNFSDRNSPNLLRCIFHAFQENNVRVPYVILTSYDERRDGLIRIGENAKM